MGSGSIHVTNGIQVIIRECVTMHLYLQLGTRDEYIIISTVMGEYSTNYVWWIVWCVCFVVAADNKLIQLWNNVGWDLSRWCHTACSLWANTAQSPKPIHTFALIVWHAWLHDCLWISLIKIEGSWIKSELLFVESTACVFSRQFCF